VLSPAPSSQFDALLRAKLTPPRLRQTAVSRRQLTERLEATHARVATVTAPAGFGKSTLLSALARTSPEPLAWLSLDARDATLRAC
jgi:LuxR family maltose regulon positive regulatory protein